MATEVLTNKSTIVVPQSILRQLRDIVDSGYAASEEEFVKEALERQISQVRRERLRQEFECAAKDPEFIRDMDEVMHDFRFVDAETAAMIDGD